MDYRRTFLLNINVLACVKLRYGTHAEQYEHLLRCAESLRHNNNYIHIMMFVLLRYISSAKKMHRGAIAPYWTIRRPGGSEVRVRARTTRRAPALWRTQVPLAHARFPTLWSAGAHLGYSTRLRGPMIH